jgi:hypothetical protein
MSGDTIESREARVRAEVRKESGEETVRRLREEREARRIALRENIREAQGAIASAGFAISDQATPLDMVRKLLARNADQKKLEDGLRERLKAAEDDVVEVKTTPHHLCRFIGPGGHCAARGDTAWCAKLGSRRIFSDQHEWPPCRLDEGPILVKKAEEDSGSAAGEAKATEGDPAGGDRLSDLESPR